MLKLKVLFWSDPMPKVANLENLNAVFINEGMEQSERLTRLNQIAIQQMKILVEDRSTQKLEG